MKDESKYLNKLQLARRYGVSQPTVNNYIGRGMPYVREGKRGGDTWLFDPLEVDEWISEWEEEKASPEENEDIVKARLEKIKVETQRLELRLKKEQDEVIDVTEVARIVGNEYSNVRTQILALPNKLAPMLVDKSDQLEINQLITKYIHEILSELTYESTGE